MKKTTSGFTLAEILILIVIVIIAILTTITVVIYNGIQDRARTTNISTLLTAYITALEMYKIDNGYYPVLSDVDEMQNGGWRSMCLGLDSDYPATPVFAKGMCTKTSVLNQPGNYTVRTSAELQTMLSRYLSQPPSITALTDERLSIYPIRGMIYTPWYSDGKVAQLEYDLFGKNSKCPQGEGNAGYFADAVRCGITLGSF